MRFIRLKGFWILGVVLSALHLGVTFYCIMASFGASMGRFDHPEMQPDRVADFLGDVAGVFMQPMMVLWQLFHLGGASSILQWAAMAANNSIWGFGLSFVVYCLTMRFSQPRPAIAARGG